jgi:hypothetical protein
MAPPGQPVQNITFVAMRPDKPVVKPKKEPLSREAEEDQTVKKTSVSSDPITCIKLLFSGGAITGPVGVGTVHSKKIVHTSMDKNALTYSSALASVACCLCAQIDIPVYLSDN